MFIALIFGVACIKLPTNISKPFVDFFESLDHIIIKVIDFIMEVAPYGVFALIGALIVEIQSIELLIALAQYSATVLLGLLIMTFGVYPALLHFFGKLDFFSL